MVANVGRSSQDLSGQWRIQHYEVGEKRAMEVAAAALDDRFWIGAAVPGDVHGALAERGIIDAPYYGHNDAKSRWIEQKEWWYRTTFNLDLHAVSGEQEHFEMIFEGLDTFATVYVNGHEVGRTANMLMSHTFDVTRLVRPGWNAVAVRFDPLFLHHHDKEQFDWSSYTKERPWLRKAAMNFGWDWGPRMVTVGIWGAVRLERSRIAKLENVYARTESIHTKHARVQVTADVRSVLSYRSRQKRTQPLVTTCDIRLLNEAGEVAANAVSLPVTGGQVHTMLHVADPRLWWTHDLGDPYLYTLEVTLYADGEMLDQYSQLFGIRTIELALQNGQGENRFAFILNGVPIYAKGANWIPADQMIGTIPDTRYKELVELSVEAHMNMLRVWAGGIYEKDVFYDECDRQGVLVWQDFAFANALFPDFNRDFMHNVRQEVRNNVLRLRSRTSLALWCGNNEIDWLYDMKTASGDITSPFYGERIYHELIPELLEELDPSRPYWPSSPYGASNGQDANDPDTGDRHNWQVWHGSVYPRKQGEVPVLDYSIEGVTFKNFKKDHALFSSEFGMHASANRYTLEKNMPEGQFYWGSPEMAYRNKDTNHQKGILLMKGYTGIPRDIEEYMNFSMLTQAEGLRYGIEHFRRINDRNRGALVWQLNDSWPGTSWSMIDYELLPKASFYYAKTFFHPVLPSLEHEPEEPLVLWVVNDTQEGIKGHLRLNVYDLHGELLYTRTDEVNAPLHSSTCIVSLQETQVLAAKQAEEVIVELVPEGFDAPVNRYFLRDPKDVKLPPSLLSVHLNEEDQSVTITASEAVARMVKLELPLGRVRFSDNYFDLLPGESRTVTLRHPEIQALPLHLLRICAMNAQEG
ncbi:glycoside hydrolase family 2 protein [Paenibacillus barcinonensis]|uniref:Beta-mannosidase B n=1 Tax=Paenibacillus barcinonensis TaxID=198119 RepID=A0A2V4VQD1_PAEBA|nr:glycoside hydrolase family 2 protein [Paenibacillus barcinonensis]PYE52319.1 beta-mannosidase [Paenibacillus barcinonensis]QKS59560.1 glycoside hydrolase family 2 protein [Paenibacillus barcinonensis]